VLLRVFLRRGIETPEQLEELGINVYASIPISELLTQKATKLEGLRRKEQSEPQTFLAIENPADIAIEAIRGLRTSLH
ncbi:tyrosine-protein kinase, partial [Acinetobacter baumannii]|nr:tyrosine-protein kinase [Acinetobacter baumannii]